MKEKMKWLGFGIIVACMLIGICSQRPYENTVAKTALGYSVGLNREVYSIKEELKLLADRKPEEVISERVAEEKSDLSGYVTKEEFEASLRGKVICGN